MVREWLWYVLITVVTAFFAKYHWDRRRLYILSWSLPGFSLPILGDGWRFFCNEEDLLSAVSKVCTEFTSPRKVWFGRRLALAYRNADQLEKIMCSMKLVNKDEVYKFIQFFTGEGLIGGSGPKWKNDRKLISPLFTYKQIARYFNICREQSDILVSYLEGYLNKQTFDIDELVHKCTAEITIETIMGTKTNAQGGDIDNILNLMNGLYVLIHSRIVKVWLQSDFIIEVLGKGRLQRQRRKQVYDFAQNFITKARARRANNKNADREDSGEGDPTCVLDSLIEMQENIPGFATDLQLIHHILTFFTAGDDPMRNVVCFLLIVFGMYPDLQKKAAQEVYDVVGPIPNKVELCDLDKLTYMDMCIKEVLRLFPIAPYIMRESSEDFQIGDILIPKGISVIACVYDIHRDPKHWEKPNEFYPEHFLPEAVANRHPYSYMPFSSGPRSCIGKPLALMASKTIMATLLQHFRVEADGVLEDRKLRTDISVRFKDGYPVRLRNMSL